MNTFLDTSTTTRPAKTGTQKVLRHGQIAQRLTNYRQEMTDVAEPGELFHHPVSFGTMLYDICVYLELSDEHITQVMGEEMSADLQAFLETPVDVTETPEA